TFWYWPLSRANAGRLNTRRHNAVRITSPPQDRGGRPPANSSLLILSLSSFPRRAKPNLWLEVPHFVAARSSNVDLGALARRCGRDRLEAAFAIARLSSFSPCPGRLPCRVARGRDAQYRPRSAGCRRGFDESLPARGWSVPWLQIPL